MVDTAVEVGPLIERNAELYGESVEKLLSRVLFQPTAMVVDDKGGEVRTVFLPGRSFNGTLGPVGGSAADVVFIGKMPWTEEDRRQQIYVGPTASLLHEVLDAEKVDYSNWYLTNVVRFMPPSHNNRLKASWVKGCMPLLEMELRILSPKVIVLLGGDAVKAVYGKSASLKKYRGADNLTYCGARVVVTNLPTAVLKEPTLRPGLEEDLHKAVQWALGKTKTRSKAEYEVIYDIARLKVVVDEIVARDSNRFVLDCEWGGMRGTKPQRCSLRSIQFTDRVSAGYCVVLRHAAPTMQEEMPVNQHCPEVQVADELNRLLGRPGVRIGGHNVRGDLIRLERMGVRCFDQFMAGGLDTMLAHHLLYPAAESNALESLAVRMTDMGRYDLPVKKWLSENHLGDKSLALELRGYADVPDELLFPVYACADVDAPMRCWEPLEKALRERPIARPYTLFGNVSMYTFYDLYRHIVHAVQPALREIEETGLLADVPRMKALAELFTSKCDEMEAGFGKSINWPNFKLRSVENVREFLYGHHYVPGKALKRPKDAMTLGLTPLKTTDKPPKDWSNVTVQDLQLGRASPSTDSESLMILSADNKRVGEVLTFRFVDQIRKNFLALPKKDNVTGQEGWLTGMVGAVDPDGYIRTELHQLTSTGRFASSSPNLNNLPNKQETELRKVFSLDLEGMLKLSDWQEMPLDELKLRGLMHPRFFTLRSCFMAAPGWLLIEADYKQAELFMMAYLSGDETMKAILNDPSRDMHSENAVEFFRLDCEPSEVKKRYRKQRVLSKAVLFGVSYGRGAAALVRSAASEGVEVSKEEAQRLIDSFFARFGSVKAFFDECKRHVDDPGYVENAYGRRRYFYPTEDRGVHAANERESQNMPNWIGHVKRGELRESLGLCIDLIPHPRYCSEYDCKITLSQA